MAPDRYRLACVVSVLLERDGQAFLLKRQNTGNRDGQWCFPAGHVEAGESFTAAALREVREEAGVDGDLGDLRFCSVVQRLDDERLTLLFRLHRFRGEPFNAEPSTCSEAGWFPLGALPTPVVDWQLQLLDLERGGQIFGEMGWVS